MKKRKNHRRAIQTPERQAKVEEYRKLFQEDWKAPYLKVKENGEFSIQWLDRSDNLTKEMKGIMEMERKIHHTMKWKLNTSGIQWRIIRKATRSDEKNSAPKTISVSKKKIEGYDPSEYLRDLADRLNANEISAETGKKMFADHIKPYEKDNRRKPIPKKASKPEPIKKTIQEQVVNKRTTPDVDHLNREISKLEGELKKAQSQYAEIYRENKRQKEEFDVIHDQYRTTITLLEDQIREKDEAFQKIQHAENEVKKAERNLWLLGFVKPAVSVLLYFGLVAWALYQIGLDVNSDLLTWTPEQHQAFMNYMLIVIVGVLILKDR